VSGLAHTLESEGIATVLIALVPQHALRMRPPRSLLVPFELGRPLGAPGDRPFQRRVLESALKLVERMDVPVVASFEEEAPEAEAEMEGWACPVSFAAPRADADVAQAVLDEVALLRPWHDRAMELRGRSGVGASGMSMEAGGRFLAGCLDVFPDSSPVAELSLADAFKLAVEDLKLFYLEAATAKPGASSQDLGEWFWRRTSAGGLLCALSQQLADAPDRAVALHAKLTLVPEQYRKEAGPAPSSHR